MRATGVVLGDVGEMREIVGVLAGAVNVANFVLANRLLSIPIIPNTNVARLIVSRFNVNPFRRNANSTNAGDCLPYSYPRLHCCLLNYRPNCNSRDETRLILRKKNSVVHLLLISCATHVENFLPQIATFSQFSN